MKLNYKRTVLVGLAFLSICAFWQMYDNVIPLILKNRFGMKETVTGAIMALDNVLALFLLPLFGSISDRIDTKLGRRIPFILGGTALAAVLMLILPYADLSVNLPLFIIALLVLLVAMGTYRSPAVALMPDVTPNVLRSKANAVINLMGAVGGVYTLAMISFLVGDGDTPNYYPLFLSVLALMVICVLVLALTIRERKLRLEAEKINAGSGEAKEPEEAQGSAKLAPEVARSMRFLLASIALWFFAYNALTTAFSRYAVSYWGMANGGYAKCLMVATVTAILSYVPIGNIASRVGRKKTILGGVVLMSACYLVGCFVSSYHGWFNIFFGLIGIGWAAINVNSYPMVVEMARGCDIGKYTGTYYTFSMAAQIATPILSGFLLEHVSYATLFPYAFTFSTLAFFTMWQVKHGDCRPEKNKGLEEAEID